MIIIKFIYFCVNFNYFFLNMSENKKDEMLLDNKKLNNIESNNNYFSSILTQKINKIFKSDNYIINNSKMEDGSSLITEAIFLHKKNILNDNSKNINVNSITPILILLMPRIYLRLI